MIRRAILAAFSIVSFLLLLAGATAATSTSPRQLDPPLVCTLSATQTGTFSYDFSGTVSTGSTPYHWTLYFGDGSDTTGVIGSSGGSYFASYTYTASGTYTVNFTAHDSRIDFGPETCSVTTRVIVQGPISVNSTLSEDLGISDAALHTPVQTLDERIRLTDATSSVPPVVLDETVGLFETFALPALHLLTEIVSVVESTNLSSVSASSTSTAQTSTSSSGGGTFSFPYQLLAIPVIAAIIAVSYLLIRRPSLLRR